MFSHQQILFINQLWSFYNCDYDFTRMMDYFSTCLDETTRFHTTHGKIKLMWMATSNPTQCHQFVTQYHQFGQHTELFPHCQHSKTKVSSLLSQVFQQEFLSVWVIYVPLAFAVEQLQFRFWFSSSWSSRVFFYVWCSWAGTQCLFCVSGFADIGMEVAGIILNLLLVKRAVHIWKSKVMEMF